MKTTASLLLALALASAAHAAEYTSVQRDKSRITFVSRQMGVPVDGRFDKFTAQLAFDPARPGAGKARIDIDLASVDAGSAEANGELAGKNWFDVRRYPTATFVSERVSDLGGGRYEAKGALTIKGKTLPVRAPFTVRTDAAGADFDGAFVLKRTAYAIGEGEWGDTDTVADAVEIKFHLRAAPAAR